MNKIKILLLLSAIRLLLIFTFILFGNKYKFYKYYFYKYIINLYIKPKNLIILNKKIIENIDVGYIVISNHQSYVDSIIIKSLIDCKFIGNAKFFNNFILKNKFDVINYDIGNKKSGKNIKKKILKNILDKNIVTVFPEGKMNNSTHDELLPFKKGLFYLAYTNNIPILMSIIYCNNPSFAIGNPTSSNNVKLKLIKELLLFDNSNIIIYELIDFVYPKDFNTFEDYYNFIYNTMNNTLKKYIS